MPGGAMALEFRVLGEVGLRRDGVAIDLGGRRPRALLALLIVDHGRPALVDSIVDRLWGDEPPDTAVKTIQVYVSRLRGAPGRRGGGLGAAPGRRAGAPFRRP